MNNILIVDDSRIARVVFESILQDAGYNVISAGSVRDAFAELGLDPLSDAPKNVDLILMDILLPETDGIEACRTLKSSEHFRDIPIIIISGLDETAHLEAAFAAGAADYIAKPANRIELLARVRFALQLKMEMDRRKAREKELLALTEQLEELNLKLQDLSSIYGLTGIANRRTLDDFLDREWKRAQRETKNLSLIMIDIDFFKLFNDTYGHQAGDDCLRSVAAVLQGLMRRPGDLVARYGGEEFVAVLPETGLFGATSLAESMSKAVSALSIKHKKSAISDHLTISIGVATIAPPPEKSYVDLIAAADLAMYKAKKAGRNRIQSSSL